jgi:hypothetical protein
MPEIPTLTPKNIEDEVASQVISAWRDQLKEELGRDEFRKLIRQISASGVVFQVQDDGVVNFYVLDEVDEETLLGMRGKGWLVYKGIDNTGNISMSGDIYATSPDDVDVQKKKGYSKKYRHGKHRQDVSARNKRTVQAMNNRGKK